jgi:hypothetical protein
VICVVPPAQAGQDHFTLQLMDRNAAHRSCYRLPRTRGYSR